MMYFYIDVKTRVFTARPETLPPTRTPTKVYTSYPEGIQYNFTYRDIKLLQCDSVITERYGERLSSSFYEAHYRDYLGHYGVEMYAFVGVMTETSETYSEYGGSFEMGAFVRASELLKETPLNTPTLSNGLYWYNTPAYSLGFLNSTDLNQDPYDKGTSSPDSRLSWTYDQDGGSGRAGSIINPPREYYKILYFCPGEPPNSPSVRPSNVPFNEIYYPTSHPVSQTLVGRKSVYITAAVTFLLGACVLIVAFAILIARCMNRNAPRLDVNYSALPDGSKLITPSALHISEI